MKKSFAITALALVALTGCSQANNSTSAPASTTASESSSQTQTTSSETPSPELATAETTPSEPQTADPLPGSTNTQYPDSQAVAAQQYTAHVADNGDITWTDQNGNPVPEVTWETVMNYPFTQEELNKIQSGLEAEFADPDATGAPGELVDHSDTPIQSDEEIANRLNSDYDQYAEEMYQQNMESATTDDEYAQAYCTGDTSSPEFDADYCAAHGF